MPPEKMLLFRKWNSIIYYCAVFFGLLASSKETRLTEKKEERAAARWYRADTLRLLAAAGLHDDRYGVLQHLPHFR